MTGDGVHGAPEIKKANASIQVSMSDLSTVLQPEHMFFPTVVPCVLFACAVVFPHWSWKWLHDVEVVSFNVRKHMLHHTLLSSNMHSSTFRRAGGTQHCVVWLHHRVGPELRERDHDAIGVLLALLSERNRSQTGTSTANDGVAR